MILLTLMIDSMGIGLVIPVMPQLIQEVEGGSIAQAALWGGIFTIGAMAHSMCMGEQLAPRYPALNDESAEVLCHRLVTYATAGIRAMAQG